MKRLRRNWSSSPKTFFIRCSENIGKFPVKTSFAFFSKFIDFWAARTAPLLKVSRIFLHVFLDFGTKLKGSNMYKASKKVVCSSNVIITYLELNFLCQFHIYTYVN